MPGKDFEKQVQQKMDELQFAPSDVVWQKVEQEIAPRKKRRVLLWLPLFFLLLGCAAWLLYPFKASHKNSQPLAAEKTIPETGKNKKDLPADRITQKEDNPQPAGAAEKIMTANKEIKPLAQRKAVPALTSAVRKKAVENKDVPVEEMAEREKTGNEYASAKTMAAGKAAQRKRFIQRSNGTDIAIRPSGLPVKNNVLQLRSKNEAGIKKRPLTATLATTAATVSTIGTDEPLPPATHTGKTFAALPETGTPDTTINSRQQTVAVEKKQAVAAIKADSAATVAVSKRTAGKKKNIDWGFSLDAGASNISKGFSKLLTGTRVADAFSVPSSQTNNGAVFNGGTTVLTEPSVIKAGFAFAAGVFISKAIGNKYSLSAGIRYSYSSTHVAVGAKTDTLIGNRTLDYHSGNAANYTNHFHFIELPVTIEKRLGNKNSRFSAAAGAAFSLLAGSNALQYDAGSNSYYKDNSRINTAQLLFLAGLHYRLLQKNMQLEIGPQFNYGISNLFNKDLYGSRHLFFAGIGTKISFSKRKK